MMAQPKDLAWMRINFPHMDWPILVFLNLKRLVNLVGISIYTDVLGQQRQIGSVRWIKSSMQKGSADISATIARHSIKIEIKVGRDHIRPKQEIYQQQIEKAGVIYLLIHTFDEFYDWYMSKYPNGT